MDKYERIQRVKEYIRYIEKMMNKYKIEEEWKDIYDTNP